MQNYFKRRTISILSFFTLLLSFVDAPSNQLPQPSFLRHPKDTTAKAGVVCSRRRGALTPILTPSEHAIWLVAAAVALSVLAPPSRSQTARSASAVCTSL